MPDGLAVAYTDEASRRRRIRWVPRDPGGWVRLEEEERDGEAWRPVGREIVADPDITMTEDVAEDVDVVPSSAGANGTVTRGP